MTMKFPLAALTGALLLAGSAAYADVTTTASSKTAGTVIGTDLDTGLSEFTLTANTYNLVLGGTSTVKTSLSSGSSWNVVAVLEKWSAGSWVDVATSNLKLVFNGSNLNPTGFGLGTVNGKSIGTAVALDAGKYQVSYTFSGAPGQVTGTTAISNLTSVPGPIAGAGLPALFGLLGFAAFRRKKAV